MVRSPLTAASATFALKAGEWFRRGRLLMVSPVHGDYRRYQAEIPLIVLSRFPGPALLSSFSMGPSNAANAAGPFVAWLRVPPRKDRSVPAVRPGRSASYNKNGCGDMQLSQIAIRDSRLNQDGCVPQWTIKVACTRFS